MFVATGVDNWLGRSDMVLLIGMYFLINYYDGDSSCSCKHIKSGYTDDFWQIPMIKKWDCN